jgi:8-amino-7-oxononanoate synthase
MSSMHTDTSTSPPRRSVAEHSLHTEEEIAQWLVEQLAANLELDEEEIDRRRPMTEFGLDSLEAVTLTGDLEDVLNRRLPPTLLFEYPTIEALARHLANLVQATEAIEEESVIPIATGERTSNGFEDHPVYRDLRSQLEMVESLALFNPFFVAIEGVNGASTTIEGQPYINFSSYNYVGLSGHPEVNRAAIEAVETMGTSASASRLASGEKPIHRQLEREIAEFIGVDDAVVYIGGHTTNMSTIACLVGPGDVVFHDSLAHDSVLQGCRLSGARQIPFPHNDWRALERLMAQRRGRYRNALVVIEGVYSMDGDIPDLKQFIETKRRHNAWLMVDEAHSLGVLGRTGRGISEYFSVLPRDVDIWMGTLSKSLASCGGYIAGSTALVTMLKYRSHGFVYSAGMPPSNAAAALAALRQLRHEPERVARLHARIARFLNGAKERGLDTGLSGGGAVVPIMVGAADLCLQLTDAICRRGVLAHPMVYPAVAQNEARLRFFITSEHTDEQIDRTLDILAEELRTLSAKKTSTVAG